MAAFFKKWQVAVAGFAAFMVATGNALVAQWDSDPATIPDWALVSTTAAVLWGLFTARPNAVTSEDAGVK